MNQIFIPLKIKTQRVPTAVKKALSGDTVMSCWMLQTTFVPMVTETPSGLMTMSVVRGALSNTRTIMVLSVVLP